MALTTPQLETLLGVLAILFVVIVYNNVAAARARRSSMAAKAATSGSTTDWFAKFARHEGSVVGEGVAVDGDRLILKQAGVFKAVALAQAEVKDDDILLTGSIDWAAAERDGAAWHASHRAAADMAVSGSLTRSEDVKAPAIDSTRDRK